jgi:hypothetical protein
LFHHILDYIYTSSVHLLCLLFFFLNAPST